MSTLGAASPAMATDGCASLRSAVAQRCGDARRAQAEHEAAADRIRAIKRDLVAARHKQDAAESAAEPQRRGAEKAAAREAYQQARRSAANEAELREATATWAQAVDRINRAGRLADRAVGKARAASAALESALREADRAVAGARVRAEQAEAACLDARVRLASCEEVAQAPAEARPASVFEPHAATGGHAVVVSATERHDPLVVETMVSGDRAALDLAARSIAERTGLDTALAQLQLQEFVDAVVSTASAEGYLVFDPRHRFWSALSPEERADVVVALARLGFQLEPSEGWHAGRAPAPLDLSMALAYAGLDARHMRQLPDAAELRALPGSVGVDARSYLAKCAPALAVDDLVRALGRRASRLEPLWNEWGQVRPVLLSPRRSLGSPTD